MFTFFAKIHKHTNIFYYVCLCIFFTTSSCATYYQKNLKFNQAFSRGEYSKADKILDSRKKAAQKKDKLIYFMNKGMLASIQSKYVESNQYFEEAYKLIDSYHTNYMNEGAALLLNSNIVEYKGEDYETLYIHYYKALNYIKLNQKTDALVECRRLNNRLNVINDKYKGKNKLKKNAFINLLMGLIYESNNEYNNAFIAYRNAYTIYEEVYESKIDVSAPEQLKIDIIRMAFLTGLDDELRFYENKFNIKYQKTKSDSNSELILFWENGLCPVKEEWSINFTVIPGGDGIVTFANADLGISLPFPVPRQEQQSSHISELQFIRVAFPKLVERRPFFSSASITANGKQYPLQLSEDVNNVAFKSLKDRMLLELSKSLLRLALKKSAEYALRSQNQEAGMALGIFNALTEKADTRQWSILPHSIYYTRMPIKVGNQEVKIDLQKANNGMETQTLQITGYENNMTFHTFSSYSYQ